MSKGIQAVRGMKDMLPEETMCWQHVETVMRDLMASYGYQEIRMPLLEKTELFKRSIGEVTDIVEKEMYTFEDRNGESLTLRPEGTASTVRAAIEHGLMQGQSLRFWYMGPMFRHERPQKGRYRQFHQLGVETFGVATPDMDAELIAMTARLWQRLGLRDLELQINSLGTPACRRDYRELLVAYLQQHRARLDEDSLRRLETNPLRILDSKNPEMQDLIEGAPRLMEYLDEESVEHFDRLRTYLDAMDIGYTINTRLVRGLDYYTRTVFEWVTTQLGAQGTVCAGGRFDGLVDQLGGKSMPAAGYALGMERLLALLEEQALLPPAAAADAFLIASGDQAQAQSLRLAEQLRQRLPALRLTVNCGGGSFKTQFKRADKSGARVALLLGDEEVAAGTIGVKYLRADKPQETVSLERVIELLTNPAG